MPYYDYECRKCGHTFEAMQTFDEHDRHEDHEQHRQIACPHCGSNKIEQAIASPYVITSRKS
jgi:putative FmdB family regulatory protein